MLISLGYDNVEDFLRRCMLKYLGVKYPHICVLLSNGSAISGGEREIETERESTARMCTCACVLACLYLEREQMWKLVAICESR